VEVHVGHPDAQRRVFLEQRLTGIDLLAQPAAYGAADEELDEAPDFVNDSPVFTPALRLIV
jgi:hypothetical protein